ncbi:xre family toxin-antitoxin system, antitoxin component [Streptomyces sp. SPB074]|nr:xre family toxin-antitoxin system, antitoxin component [Streptomyces sp. SPB074]
MEVHFRTQSGVTQAELARALNVERSLVSEFESGDRVPDLKHAEDADAFLNAGGALVELWKETDWYPQVEHPDWFERRAWMDAEATSVHLYQAMLMPGLMQTPEYAEALLERFEEDKPMGERVQARMSRQARFRVPNGPILVAVLDESVLRNVVKSSEIMAAQCKYLLDMGQLPNVRVQVVPADSPRINRPDASMSLIALPDGTTTVYSESLDRGHFIVEPKLVAQHARTYDVLRADSLSAAHSTALIRDAMERYERHEAPRLVRRELDQEQLQRNQRRRLRGNRTRLPRPRPRS